MKVVHAPSAGGPEVLVMDQRSIPPLRAREILIKVSAAGVNRADILQRQGHYPPPDDAPPWLGLEASGTVADVGPHVRDRAIGDRVCAVLPGGGYAEYVVVDERLALPTPWGVTDTQAAGIMEAACTVESTLNALGARAGQRILIHGGSGGVGSWAVQVARARGLWVATTAGDDARTQLCRDLGADLAITYRTTDVAAAVREAGGVDLVLDILGAGAIDDNLSVLNTDGAMGIIGLQRGRHASLDLGVVLAKRLRIVGTTLRSRPLADKADIVAAVHRNQWPAIPDHIRPVIGATYPLEQAADAHRALEAGEVFGKVVLTFA